LQFVFIHCCQFGWLMVVFRRRDGGGCGFDVD
jgi:hypothetical protein